MFSGGILASMGGQVICLLNILLWYALHIVSQKCIKTFTMLV